MRALGVFIEFFQETINDYRNERLQPYMFRGRKPPACGRMQCAYRVDGVSVDGINSLNSLSSFFRLKQVLHPRHFLFQCSHETD